MFLDKTLERYNSIYPSTKVTEHKISTQKIGDVNSKKWLILATNSVDKYDLLSHHNLHFIPYEYVSRILRGPSTRIENINQRYCGIISKLINPPTPEDLLPDEKININDFATKIADAIVAKFIQIVGNHQPTNTATLKSLAAHHDLFPVIHKIMLDNIYEIKNAQNKQYKAELFISASADMANIIQNFQLSVNNAFDSLGITNIMFKEHSGDSLYTMLISRISPIYLKIIMEILSGKTNIFANIQNKNKQLNTTNIILYM